MPRRRRIPALVPHGLTSRRVDTYAAPGKRRREPRPRASEPWRKTGYGAGYRRARQAVIARADGKCERCGKTVAVQGDDGTWRSRGGEVHHVRPLCAGGNADTSNLMLLCVSCHRLADAERRRQEG